MESCERCMNLVKIPTVLYCTFLSYHFSVIDFGN
jgi:hypothetical protein